MAKQLSTPEVWRQLADRDLMVAEYLATNMYPPQCEIICYHCQQAAEKYLKSFLAFHGEEPPYIHDLSEICKSCEKYENSFSTISVMCSLVTHYGVLPRYDIGLSINTGDMEQALKNTKAIMAFVKTIIPDVFMR
jgi:HEPN domain-containing protein